VVSDRELRELERRAEEAACRAYAPYSRFTVGAAVLTEDGLVFEGCNIENASYGLTVCGERAAMYNAIAAGARRIRALAVICPQGKPDTDPRSVMPCGACRQVMAEFMDVDGVILVAGVGTFTLADLLPESFHL
jgi:cytidine deaminase